MEAENILIVKKVENKWAKNMRFQEANICNIFDLLIFKNIPGEISVFQFGRSFLKAVVSLYTKQRLFSVKTFIIRMFI